MDWTLEGPIKMVPFSFTKEKAVQVDPERLL